MFDPLDFSKTKIIAHRGASFDAPENTVAAARLAWEQGADLLELDIHLTCDKQIVAIHDATTRRTTAFKGIVEQMTLAELRQLDAGRFKHARYLGERIPTLEEMIAATPAGKGLVIEIKNGHDIIPRLQAVLSASSKPLAHFTIISFDADAVKTAKAALPECPALWIVDYNPRQHQLSDLMQHCRENHFDGLDLHRRWPIDRIFVQQMKNHDLLLYTWTVDSPRTARRQAEAGVDGITTNRPGWLRQQLLE